MKRPVLLQTSSPIGLYVHVYQFNILTAKAGLMHVYTPVEM